MSMPRGVFVLARTGSGRPALQHRVLETDIDTTVCGLNMKLWSRSYNKTCFTAIYCKKCAKR
jgi:hypothetical protein